ncbi:MAG: YiiX/YebB-like N1pC/P60 family cysteine hydrolase [Planctomycetaceae bacterium]
MLATSLIVIALSASPLTELPQDAEIPATSDLPSGTLLFSQGDCLAVKVFSGSSFTHVAMVCRTGEEVMVYDANPGTGVRCQRLEAYLNCIAPDEVHVMVPQREMSNNELEKLTAFLDSKIGTPYAVLHHSTGQRAEGVHCSEYLTDALCEIDWLEAKSPPRVSPGSLLVGVASPNIYRSAGLIQIEEELPAPPPDAGRCGRMWFETKQCCQQCCKKLSRVFLCR